MQVFFVINDIIIILILQKTPAIYARLLKKSIKIKYFNVLITFFFDDDNDINIVFETFTDSLIANLLL